MSKEDEVQTSFMPLPLHQRFEKFITFSDLTKVRIIQKAVVYVIGLSSSLANKEILFKEEYFGQYGQIVKIVVNKNGYAQNRQSEPTYSAYVTFDSPENASLALLAIDNTEIDGHVIRSSFGTTKYCSFFLRNMDCANKDCLYLHSLADEEDTLYKEDSYSNKTIFSQQHRIAMKIADVYNKELKLKKSHGLVSSGFPSIDSIYQKEFLFDNNKINNLNLNHNHNHNYNHNHNHIHIKNIRKYSAYDAFPQSSNQRNEKVEEEEVEYVLVKEPSKKNRKWKPSQQVSKGEIKKRKRNYTLEDIQMPKQHDQISSPSSASTNSSNKTMTKKFITRKRQLFNTSTESRFDFVNKSKTTTTTKATTMTKETIDKCQFSDIPEFVQDIIYKKTSSYSFFRQFDSNIVNDKEILSTEYNQINAWNESNCQLD